MNHQLTDLLDIPRLQAALDSLYASSKIPSAIIDIEGKIHAGSGWQDVCTKFHRVHPEARKRCMESDTYIARHIREANPSIAYKCPHGLVDTATPILIEGEHIGNVFTGQLFLGPPDLEYFRAQAKALGFDEETYIDAVKKVPIVTEKELKENMAFLAHLTGMLTEMGLKRAREKEAEKRLRESEERYRSLFGKGSDGIFIMSPDGKIVEVNESFARMHGYSKEDLLRMNIRELDAPETSKLFPERMRRVLAGETLAIEVEHQHKNGHVFPMEVSASLISVGGESFIQCFHRDITDHKRAEAEKEKLQLQLQQAMKMEAVGRLAGGVAHDFNNLLTVITGYSELLLRKIGKESPMHAEVEEIRRAGERAASLTRQLLAFSRKQIIEPKVVRLDLLVADMQAMLIRLIGENIALQATTGTSLGSVRIDPGQFQQILMNLAVNARDAMPDGGKIVTETANVDLDETYCASHAYVTPGRYVMLAVSDTGHGMSEEVKAHIFEPFFTTKERGSGTGLGLATTYGAVHQAGGSIEVYSEAGIGTTIKIYLPRVEGEAGSPVRDDRPTVLPGGTETVLVVEDEAIVRTLCVQILEQLGYRVLKARNGKEAIAEAQGYGDRIDLLLTDVVMPGMNGADLATQLVLHHPEMKVLFTSGYTDDAIVRHGVLDEGVSFIGKPYTPLALARKVREVLDEA